MKESKIKLLKEKLLSSKKNRVIAALAALTIGNLFALSSITFAWFVTNANTKSSINTFSGDLDININKVSAYKYVYPYYNNSADFIDYDGDGVVKSYVLKDSSIEIPENLSDTVTIPLTVLEGQTCNGGGEKTATNISFERSQDFKYYLIGNSTFNGVTNNPWSTLTATAFSRRDIPVATDDPTDDQTAIVKNVVLSQGSEFILFDVRTVNNLNTTCSYFTYGTPVPETSKNSRFAILDNNRIKCLESGIYAIRYRINSSGDKFLDINLTARGDNAIIGSNLIDPTKISIDYRGSVDKEEFPDITDYLSTAIQEQNTMVVLDVEVKYQNKIDIDAGLKIMREGVSAQSIYSFTGKYNTTDAYTYLGYQDDENRNPLNASDFYTFYSVIAKEENKYASPTFAWEAFHALKTDQQEDAQYIYQKYQNNTTFDREIQMNVKSKTMSDSTIIPGSLEESTYHIYIAIDYDYAYTNFFINQERLGKTYYLDRDFGFYFTATQRLEPSPSPIYKEGGDEND